MIMKPHLYAMPGQQFLWLLKAPPEFDDGHVSVIAVPTGWLYAISGREYETRGWSLVPDKDHSMNPRALVPPGWQDGVESRTYNTEHQRLADLIWESGADDAVDVVPTGYRGRVTSIESDPSGLKLLQSIYDSLEEDCPRNIHLAGPRPSADCLGFFLNPKRGNEVLASRQYRVVILEDKN